MNDDCFRSVRLHKRGGFLKFNPAGGGNMRHGIRTPDSLVFRAGKRMIRQQAHRRNNGQRGEKFCGLRQILRVVIVSGNKRNADFYCFTRFCNETDVFQNPSFGAPVSLRWRLLANAFRSSRKRSVNGRTVSMAQRGTLTQESTFNRTCRHAQTVEFPSVSSSADSGSRAGLGIVHGQ